MIGDHVHEWDDNGDCLHSFCYGRRDPMADVRTLARDLDSRWPAMHRDGWQPFAPAEDAHLAATTREERAGQTRNEDIRRVVALLRDEHDVKQAHAQMLVSLWAQCQTLGLQGPTLLVGVSS